MRTSEEATPYLTIELDGDHDFQKVGIGDLNGDGRLDYVIKQPDFNVDPSILGSWKPSREPYKLEAYDHDGTFLWRHDLGWAIEEGVWYSPYTVYDLDGDGKAEVALKGSDGKDHRNENQRVRTGPEYLTILDGEAGRLKARTDWPSREGYLNYPQEAYGDSSRNQMAVAYLDGKTPCLVLLRGTYGLMKVVAYQLLSLIHI